MYPYEAKEFIHKTERDFKGNPIVYTKVAEARVWKSLVNRTYSYLIPVMHPYGCGIDYISEEEIDNFTWR